MKKKNLDDKNCFVQCLTRYFNVKPSHYVSEIQSIYLIEQSIRGSLIHAIMAGVHNCLVVLLGRSLTKARDK